MRLTDVGPGNFDTLLCCGIKCPTHPGRQQKRRWLQANAKFGLRAKIFLGPDGQPVGYIEYIPGEFAWRGVEARGYMFIHCIWIFRQSQRRGWDRFMIEACLEDAKKAGMNGVAVMVRGGPGSPLKSWRDAQNAPTPYAVFSLIYNGELVADQQISGTRFRNIMNKLTG